MLDAEAIIVGDLKTQLISFGGHDAAVRDFAERLLATVNILEVKMAFRQMMNTNNDGMLVWERMQPKYTETYARMIDGS